VLSHPASLADVPPDLMPEDFSNRELGDAYEAIRLIEANGETPSTLRVCS